MVGLDLRDTTPTDPSNVSKQVNTPSYRYFNPRDESWSLCNFITYQEGECNLPTILSDLLDNLYVIWFDDRSGYWEIYLQRKDAVTGLWSSSDLIVSELDMYASRDASAAVDPEGNLHIIWNTIYGYSAKMYYRMRDSISGDFTPIEEVTDSVFNNAERPLIAIDSSGRIHFVWLDSKDGNLEIYHRIKDGSTWLPSERLTNNVLKDQAPYITADQAGDIHLIFLQGESTDLYKFYYMKWSHSTFTWSPPVILVEKTVVRTVYGPKITADRFGYLHVIWTDERDDDNWEIYYKKYSPIAPDYELYMDKSEYIGLADQISVTVVDASQNKNLFGKDELKVRIFSDTDPDGIYVPLKETTNNSSIFTTASLGYSVHFTLSASDPLIPKIQVFDGDKITVEYLDDSPLDVRQTTAYWYQFMKPTPTPSVPFNQTSLILIFLFTLLIGNLVQMFRFFIHQQ
ncbi:MAG: hypothetical protein A2161_14235 [Candidatus Schekmanbacteria bacterium RBG_13_48_7]|uniref:Uncharacterized protein n=1 Tax=Candidatus Schekmanbacteria bacterium RBG_13_48_7 TaxID=1817878 RepID=A0A1F7S013_9BACT|nr:MAG: hypothetical protein A2161_14235 [Candidatus Schekmanbacteria bacterium RBG_13_48_7]